MTVPLRFGRKHPLPAIGDRFTRLVVIGPAFRDGRAWRVPCRCDCGKEHTPLFSTLIAEYCRSCGCLLAETAARLNAKSFEQCVRDFWDRVHKQESGCWLYAGNKNNMGYGYLTVNKRRMLAHRFSWELRHGPIPNGKLACHHCDTPSCVNPDHLFIGTHKDNSQDMARKGRANGQRR